MRITLLLLLVACSSFAQNVQKEINEQVWKPFIKGFNEGNTELFMSVHSKDVVRSPRDGKEVLNWSAYNKSTADWNAQRNAKFNLELHFTERLNSDNQAVEVGIYKTSSTGADGVTRSGYGRFHVVHRKENGKWKILVDTDSSEGETIGETQFLAAKPME